MKPVGVEKAMTRCDVLIVGAGPTGLVLALWLTKLGVRVRIIDKTAEPGTTSRALAVHARTLELYRQLDLTDFVRAHGHKVPAVRFWVKGEARARVSFEEVGADLTPYPFLQIFPQDEHERLLIARLKAMGVSVERQTELLGYDDDGERIVARLRAAEGRQDECAAAYIAGCDGARSVVRQTMGLDFPGATYGRSSMSPMSRHPARRSTATCMPISTRPTSLPCFPLPARDAPG